MLNVKRDSVSHNRLSKKPKNSEFLKLSHFKPHAWEIDLLDSLISMFRAVECLGAGCFSDQCES